MPTLAAPNKRQESFPISDFSDQLRENLARKKAAALVREVFRPLLEEFGEVMEEENSKLQIRNPKQIINSKIQ